ALLAALNPFLLAGSAADSVITTAVNLWHYDRLSAPEREALARYRTLLEREPQTRDAPEIAHAIRRLGTKRAAALCKDTLELAQKALDTDDLDHAAFYAHAADRIDGCADDAARALARVNEARARRAARGAAGAGGRAGHRDAGRTGLADLAGDHGASAGRHAAAVLGSADYSALDAIREAERRHARDTARYVLLGGRMDGRNALYTASQFGAQGAQAAESFGIFNVIGLLTRAWQAWRHDPVSNQAIIDRGEAFL